MNDRAEILQRLSGDEKFLLTTHENPDGDALGSLVAMNWILQSLDKDVVMFVPATEFPLPYEYRNLLRAEDVITAVPADLADRTVVYLDCGDFTRMDIPEFREGGRLLINIDHHKGNDGFGDLALVEADRSSTAEMVYTIAKDLGVTITTSIADALYVGLITDTGCFMYQNTGAHAHEMAADLIASGVDVHAAYQRIFEGQPLGKVQLLGRALATLQQFDDGALTIVNLTADDFVQTSSEQSYTEGIVDHARAIEGTLVGAMYRELATDDGAARAKLSMRSSDDRIDVEQIASVFGGGGHRQAAGATTDKSLEEAIELIRDGIRRQLGDAAAA